MPFFPRSRVAAFIAAATLCRPEFIWLVKAALAVVDTLSVAVVFLLAGELFLNRHLSLLAAAAIYPFFVAQACDVQTEDLLMFFFLAAIWSTLKAARRPVPSLMLAAGVCAGWRPSFVRLVLFSWLLLPATLICLGGRWEP
jgi:hypothetical protein